MLRRVANPLRNLIRNTRNTSTMTKSHGNYDNVFSQTVDYAPVHLERWRSRVTGLNVAQVKHESPMCEAYFVVPTEIFDDSGCPHTLEHLVFLGSKLYPYKGVLDTLANRAFAAGTNAWTDSECNLDH